MPSDDDKKPLIRLPRFLRHFIRRLQQRPTTVAPKIDPFTFVRYRFRRSDLQSIIKPLTLMIIFFATFTFIYVLLHSHKILDLECYVSGNSFVQPNGVLSVNNTRKGGPGSFAMTFSCSDGFLGNGEQMIWGSAKTRGKSNIEAEVLLNTWEWEFRRSWRNAYLDSLGDNTTSWSNTDETFFGFKVDTYKNLTDTFGLVSKNVSTSGLYTKNASWVNVTNPLLLNSLKPLKEYKIDFAMELLNNRTILSTIYTDMVTYCNTVNGQVSLNTQFNRNLVYLVVLSLMFIIAAAGWVTHTIRRRERMDDYTLAFQLTFEQLHFTWSEPEVVICLLLFMLSSLTFISTFFVEWYLNPALSLSSTTNMYCAKSSSYTFAWLFIIVSSFMFVSWFGMMISHSQSFMELFIVKIVRYYFKRSRIYQAAVHIVKEKDNKEHPEAKFEGSAIALVQPEDEFPQTGDEHKLRELIYIPFSPDSATIFTFTVGLKFFIWLIAFVFYLPYQVLGSMFAFAFTGVTVHPFAETTPHFQLKLFKTLQKRPTVVIDGEYFVFMDDHYHKMIKLNGEKPPAILKAPKKLSKFAIRAFRNQGVLLKKIDEDSDYTDPSDDEYDGVGRIITRSSVLEDNSENEGLGA